MTVVVFLDLSSGKYGEEPMANLLSGPDLNLVYRAKLQASVEEWWGWNTAIDLSNSTY